MATLETLVGAGILVLVVLAVVLVWRWGQREPAPATRGKRRIRKVQRSVIQLIAEAARDTHPNEFSGLLRAQGETITELVLSPPGSLGGSTHAIIRFENLHADTTICGTVHSHPSPEALPSYADRELFGSFGNTHIIMAAPYDERSWRAYDGTGADVELEVVEG